MTKKFEIPTKATMPKGELTDQSILVYGMPKIGKSSFAASFPGALFLPFEPGLNHLEHFQIPSEGIISSWDEMLQACKLIAKGEHPFQTVIIDTVDLCYQTCAESVCKKRGVEYTGDIAHGKGWSLVANEFMRVMKALAGLPYGLVLISHAKSRSVEINGIERDVVQTTLTDSVRKVLAGMVDMILYVDVAEKTGDDGAVEYCRVLRTKPSKRFDAGDRTGRLPPTIEIKQENPFRDFKEAWDGSGCERKAEAASVEKTNIKTTDRKKGGTKA